VAEYRSKTAAVHIGTTCVLTYMIGYYMRKLLSVTTPVLLAQGYTEAFVGVLSFAYMLMYAVGQLVNGRLGDRLRPRWMILMGLTLPGVSQLLFPFMPWRGAQVLCFAALGFFLSMLRGPLVKAISENMHAHHARLACVGISVVTYVGPLLASLLAIVFRWDWVFIVGGGFGAAMGPVLWVVFSRLEKAGETVFCAPEPTEKKGSYRALFRLDRFVMFMFLSALFEISGASIDAWISTYLVQHLGYPVNTANLIYSAMSILGAVCPVLCLVLLRLFRDSDVRTMQWVLAVAAILYGLMTVVRQPLVNTVLFVLAMMATTVASSVLWSIYIPSLSRSGQVSTANGVLDFCGYVGAAVAGLIVSNVIGLFGWTGVLLIWGGVPTLGFAIVTVNRLRRSRQKN
jgi:sugar phosphate permease